MGSAAWTEMANKYTFPCLDVFRAFGLSPDNILIFSYFYIFTIRNKVISRKTPVIFRTNLVIFLTNKVLFWSIPVIFGTNPAILKANKVIFRANPVHYNNKFSHI